MSNRLGAHPPWRQLLIVSVALPVIVATAVLAFAWPAAHIAPRDVPIGVVAPGPVNAQVVRGLDQAQPGAFDVRAYVDQEAARQAIRHRDAYGALVVTPHEITVLTASAASPTVAAILTTAGDHIAARLGARSQEVDVVATSPHDPHGLVLGAALLPLTICSIIVSAVVALLVRFTPAWRQLVGLVIVCATAGLGAFLIAETWLGALPGHPWGTWGALTLTILAMSAATTGLIALIGSSGLGVGAALMVFVGNPSSGTTSAPELLPKAVGAIGQWLPPGAGANLVRSTAYFQGHGIGRPLAVLVLWTAFGAAGVLAGHHTFVGYAARRRRAQVDATLQGVG